MESATAPAVSAAALPTADAASPTHPTALPTESRHPSELDEPELDDPELDDPAAPGQVGIDTSYSEDLGVVQSGKDEASPYAVHGVPCSLDVPYKSHCQCAMVFGIP